MSFLIDRPHRPTGLGNMIVLLKKSPKSLHAPFCVHLIKRLLVCALLRLEYYWRLLMNCCTLVKLRYFWWMLPIIHIKLILGPLLKLGSYVTAVEGNSTSTSSPSSFLLSLLPPSTSWGGRSGDLQVVMILILPRSSIISLVSQVEWNTTACPTKTSLESRYLS